QARADRPVGVLAQQRVAQGGVDRVLGIVEGLDRVQRLDLAVGGPHDRLVVVARRGVGGRRQAVDRAGAGGGADQLGGGGQGPAATGQRERRRAHRGQGGQERARASQEEASSIVEDPTRSISLMRRSV